MTSNWLFDPDGTLLEGPQGPVSHLICGGVYDWSTGLIFKGGRYFDPNLGIWLALMPLVVVQSWRGRKRKRRGMPWYVLAAVVVVGVGGMLVGCEPTPTPGDTPKTPTSVCTDTPTPVPPTPMPEPPTPTPKTPEPTPETPEPAPTPTPCPEVPEVPGIPTPHTRAGYQLVRDELQNTCPEWIDDACKIKDQALIALSIQTEFFGLKGDVYQEALEAMAWNWKILGCGESGSCQTFQEQIQWIQYFEAWGYAGQYSDISYVTKDGNWQARLKDALLVFADYKHYFPNEDPEKTPRSTHWGNPRKDSPAYKYIKGEGEASWWPYAGEPFVIVDKDLEPPFVVMTFEQNARCGDAKCSGF